MSIPARSRCAVRLARLLAFACLAALLCTRPARAEKVPITPESPEGQNIANAANLLEKVGEVDVANRVRDRLNNGNYSYDTELSENAETGTGSQYTNIAERVIRFSHVPALRDKPWDLEKQFDMIFGLARTLFHEDVHSGQGYFSSLWGSLPGETTYETDAWTKTIAAEGAWIHNAFAQHTFTYGQLSIMAADLSGYIGSFKDQKQPWYGLPADLQPIYLNIAENAQFFSERFKQMAQNPPPASAVSGEGRQPANPPATPASTSPCARYANCPPALDWCERAEWFRQQAAKERQWAQESRQAGRESEAEGFEHMAKMDDSMAAIRDREAEYAYRECQRKRGITTATGPGAATDTGASATPVNFPTGPQDCRFYKMMAADARKDAEFWKHQVDLDQARIRDATSPEVKQTAENDLQKDEARVRDREQKAEEWERKLAACPEEYRAAVDSPPPATATGAGTGAAPAPSGETGANAAGGTPLTPTSGAPQQPCPTQADCDKLCAAAAQAEREAAAAKAALVQAEADRQRDLDKGNQAEKDAEMQKYNRDNRISVNMEIAAQRRTYAKKLREDADAAVAKAKAEAEAKAQAAAAARAACDACRPCPEQTKTAMKTGSDANAQTSKPLVIGGNYMGRSGVNLADDEFVVETVEGETWTSGLSILDNALEFKDKVQLPLQPSSPEKPATGQKPSDPTLFSPTFTGLRLGFTFDGTSAGTTPAADPEKQSIFTYLGKVETVVSSTLPQPSQNRKDHGVARSTGRRQASDPRRSQPALQLAAYRTTTVLPSRFQDASAPQSAPLSKPTPPTQPAPLPFSIAANGKTGDEALQLQVFDPSGKLKQVRLRSGVVLEPLKPTGTAPKSFAERHAGAAGKLLTQQISALCLDFAKLPPAAGTLYRLAPRAVQEKFKPLRSILEAGQKLADSGKLHPDSEPKAYATFIRQFALWTKLENWDAAKFTEMFIQHSKKSAEVQNFKWTKEVEDELRAAAPSRWQDIAAVLTEAEAISKASVNKSSD